MVHGVADEVGQGIADGLDDGAVQVRLPPLHLDADRLVARGGQVPDHARELAPDVADGLHPGLHDPLLELRGDEVETLGRGGQPAVVLHGGVLEHLIARQDQLAHQVHERVQEPDADADAGVGDMGLGRVRCGATGPVFGLAGGGVGHGLRVVNLDDLTVIVSLVARLDGVRVDGTGDGDVLGRGRRVLSLCQGVQLLPQGLVLVRAFSVPRLDEGEDATDRVAHSKQRGGDLGVEGELVVPEQ